jgi:transcriptional regulator with XRE-family HTH domain
MNDSIIILQRFGDTVKHHRLRLGISQEEMGWRGDLHRNDAGHFERAARMPRVEVLLRVAAALEVPMRELLKGMRWRPARVIPGRYVFEEVEDRPPRQQRPERPVCPVPGFYVIGDKRLAEWEVGL